MPTGISILFHNKHIGKLPPLFGLFGICSEINSHNKIHKSSQHTVNIHICTAHTLKAQLCQKRYEIDIKLGDNPHAANTTWRLVSG